MHSLYKRRLKILDKKPARYHHCHIITKYNLLTLDNFVYLANSRLIYKITHNLTPPPTDSLLHYDQITSGKQEHLPEATV